MRRTIPPLTALAVSLALAVALAPTPPAAGLQANDEQDEKKAERQERKSDKKQARENEKTLPQKYQEWLDLVAALITKTERQAFLLLEKDYQRDAFIEDFWKVRDKYPSTARNEFRERYMERAREAQEIFGHLDSDRSVIYLLNGAPAGRLEIDCVALWPIDIWFYARGQVGDETYLLFYQQFKNGPYRVWNPGDGLGKIARFVATSVEQVAEEIRRDCLQSDDLLAIISRLRRQGAMDYSMLLARLMEPPEIPGEGEWVTTFHSYSTDVPEDAPRFTAKLEVSYPGRHQSRTMLQGVLKVPLEEAAVATLGDANTYNFVLIGEVLRDGALFDNFQYKFNQPASSVNGADVPILFERYLRPGRYDLVLRLQDLNSDKFFGDRISLEVPAVDRTIPAPPQDPETESLLAEANAAINSGDNTLQIVKPQGNILTGMMRFDTLTTGRDIAQVAFTFDGRQEYRKTRPPFSVELDLGNLPRTRTLTAVAYDANGEELARDELLINTGKHRFSVRLVEPRPGKKYDRSLRALADVTVPEGESVERVEFYINETLVSEMYQPPWEYPILLPEGGQLAYVRAVAHQADGNMTEDVVFVNAPEYLEEVDIQFVELYITATDKDNKPVADLSASDFVVREDGVAQSTARFERVKNLPIHAGILVDVSASMEDELDTAQAAALGFFQQAIREKDRATLITFNDHPTMVVGFTNNHRTLAGGLAGLAAQRGTSLYDSVIFSLYFFNGIKGQRALIILSDGKDESSRFTFEDTLEYARRTGVAIYGIGLKIPKTDRSVRKKLNQLAEETGGRSFFVSSGEELAAIYEAIQEELRSRYYLAYQSTNSSADEAFRTVEVEVLRPGVEAKTLRGYYP